MRKLLAVFASVIISLSLFVLVAFASQEVIEWGSQYLFDEPQYAKITANGSTYTEVSHSFNSVGFTYINAECEYSGASFITRMQKKGFLGIWSTTLTSNCTHLNTSVEWGLGGEYGKGKYRFELEPQNNFVPNANGLGGTRYAINIQKFYSKSDP